MLNRPLVDGFRLFVLAAAIGGALVGGLYVAASSARADLPQPGNAAPSLAPPPAVAVSTLPEPSDSIVEPASADIPVGIDVTDGAALPDHVAAIAEQVEAEDEADEELLLDEATGLRMGPLTIRPASAPLPERIATAPHPARPRAPVPPPVRLHSDPGLNVIAIARSMIARGETVHGSCHRYLDEVFARAGNGGWRTRTTVHAADRDGPYANLDLIRPGDWLYIVNHPESTPVGTHSVLFVGWEDRASGYARVIEHPGWSSGPSSGRERGYDVSRTYRITRPR